MDLYGTKAITLIMITLVTLGADGSIFMKEPCAARALWQKIPGQYQQQAGFYTDLYEPYVGVIPENQHHPATKDSGLTNHIERFNCTLRQRVSRLVGDSLALSKTLVNHIGTIHYLCAITI